MFRVLVLFLVGYAHLYSHQAFKVVEDAEKYSHHSQLQWDWAMRSLQRFDFEHSMSILDVGCGDGKITALIAKKHPNASVFGYDLSSAMLKVARDAHSSASNLFFMDGDVIHLPFEGMFDSVVSFCCLHWVDDQMLALEKIYHSLRPTGRALLVLPVDCPTAISVIAQRLMKTGKWQHVYNDSLTFRNYYSEEEYREFIAKTDFILESMEIEEVLSPFENEECFIEWLLPLLSYTKHLSKDEELAFAKDLFEELKGISPFLPDGSFLLPLRKMKVVVQKI